MTNYEKIKAMSIYQYDDYCPDDGGKGCIQGVVKWLESEVEEE